MQAPGQEQAAADDGKNPFEYLTLAPFAGDRNHPDGAAAPSTSKTAFTQKRFCVTQAMAWTIDAMLCPHYV